MSIPSSWLGAPGVKMHSFLITRMHFNQISVTRNVHPLWSGSTLSAHKPHTPTHVPAQYYRTGPVLAFNATMGSSEPVGDYAMPKQFEHTQHNHKAPECTPNASHLTRRVSERVNWRRLCVRRELLIAELPSSTSTSSSTTRTCKMG